MDCDNEKLCFSEDRRKTCGFYSINGHISGFRADMDIKARYSQEDTTAPQHGY